jgi:SAM-dependent methyltransferase
MNTARGFRAVYDVDGVYDEHLLRHCYDGQEDTELLAALLAQHYGAPGADLEVVEFGCGTGRVTEHLVPYARRITGVDSSPAMLATLAERCPTVEPVCADTRKAVTNLHELGRVGSFDLVGAFWSLSYPLGEYFETLTAEGITPRADHGRAREEALGFVHDLARLVGPGGHLIALFFDADTPEQRLVTRLWERVAPFPEGGRGYTFQLLLDGLRRAERTVGGTLTHTRHTGVAWAPTAAAAVDWFTVVHLKNLPALVDDPDVQREVGDFVLRHAQPSGEVALPSGVHVIDHADVTADVHADVGAAPHR